MPSCLRLATKGALLLALGISTLAACGDDSGNASGGSESDTETGGIMTDSATSATTGMTMSGGATSIATDSASGMSESATTDATDTAATDSATATDSGTDSGTDTDTDTDGTGGSTGDTEGGIPCDDAADCDDLLFCTGEETCVDGFCEAGTEVTCDDGVACTTDSCDEDSMGCIAVADDAFCSDGVFCNGPEVCDVLNGCGPGMAITCDDGVPCTDDACDEDADACGFTVNDANCTNNLFCDGEEVCDLVSDCMPGDPPENGCNDLINCTNDSCDEDADMCVYTADDTICDNGAFCDGDETCDVDNGCMPGTDVVCAMDAHACTIEACNETDDECQTTLDNTVCNAGEFCTTGGCATGTQCADDTDCDDGLGCNGIETCDLTNVPGTCVPGDPILCFDGIACTFDACDEDIDACVFTANDAACTDTNLCNGDETCDPDSGCVAGTPLVCDDSVACTNDQCFAAFGCFNTTDDTLCQDDSACNGAEVCDDTLGCQPAGGPLVCPGDGIDCTQEVCDEAFGGCRTILDDSQCGCGEHCDSSLGCTDQCSPATCNGTIWECGDCADNDADCTIDAFDLDCFGVCDDNEAGFKEEIPGQAAPPCKMDCYFDNNSGSGNDDCFWSHECDPLQPSLENDGCTYDPDANIPGTGDDCATLMDTQSTECLDICGPVVPNGCDCFGCCEVHANDTIYTVYLGSEDSSDDGECSFDVIDDPTSCHPCTQVQGCLNPCENCEICFGQSELPPECTVQDCDETEPCGLPGQLPCAPGEFCLTGCCTGF